MIFTIYRWVVYYTCKTLFILYLQTHITRNFSLSKSHTNCTFLRPVQHNSCPLRLVDQSNICADYMWIMCATFGVCFKFLTLFVFEMYGTQKSGNLETVSTFWIDLMIASFGRSLCKFNESQFIIVFTFKMHIHQLFFSFSLWDISCQKASRSGWTCSLFLIIRLVLK